MRTFNNYILEKQNFIFGGKAGLTGREYDPEAEAMNWEKSVESFQWKYDDDLDILFNNIRCKFDMLPFEQINIKDIYDYYQETIPKAEFVWYDETLEDTGIAHRGIELRKAENVMGSLTIYEFLFKGKMIAIFVF